MGKGAVWMTEERRVVSIAYLSATYNSVNGKDQASSTFWASVEEKLCMIPMKDGFIVSRPASALKSYCNNNIFPDVAKFNISLQLMEASKPTGVTMQEIVNMAVAKHTGVATCRDYKFRDYRADTWPNYSAWMVLKDHPKFKPSMMLPSLYSTDKENVETSKENGDKEDVTVTLVSTPAASNVIFQQIGQKKAKREKYSRDGNIQKSLNGDSERVAQLLKAIQERNVIQSKASQEQERCNRMQQRKRRIQELKDLMEMTQEVESVVYQETRWKLINLLQTDDEEPEQTIDEKSERGSDGNLLNQEIEVKDSDISVLED